MVGFYIFMFICALLIPAAMLLFGYRWQKHAPDKVNCLYGYRTKKSMSSKKAWDYAHRCLAKQWVAAGWVTGFISVCFMVILAFITLEVSKVGVFSCILVFFQLIPLIAPILVTERELKNKFGL